MSNKVGDELQQSIQNEQSRLKFKMHQFNFRNLKNRTRELTSRIDSSKIKKTLDSEYKVGSIISALNQ